MEPSDRSASWVTASAKLARNGSANVIGIEGLRKALGERWAKTREDVGRSLETLLRQKLRPADFFLALDDRHTLVIMPKTAAEDGEIACLSIAYELSRTFLGACGIGDLDVTPARAVGDTIIEVDAFDRAALVDLAGKAGLQLAPDGETVAPAPFGEAEIAVAYAPVWDAQFQVIRAYRCLACDGHRPYGPENSGQRLRELSHLTLTLLERGGAELERHLRRGERFVLGIPVSYEVLTSPLARMAFLGRCRALSADLRPYLAYTVKDLPLGMPQPRVAEVVTILKAFCGAVLIRAPRRAGPRLDVFGASGVKAVGVSLRGLDPADYNVELGNLAAEARRAGLISFAEHVDSEDALRAALDRQVKWLSGTAVAPAVSEPGPLKSLPRAQLFHHAA